jgi:lysophospholipase L1-like esterase
MATVFHRNRGFTIAAVAATLLLWAVYEHSGREASLSKGGYQADDGPSEDAIASPAHPNKENPLWMKLHGQLVDEVKALHKQRNVEVLFYGDSILESLRGTSFGLETERAKGCPEVFSKHFGNVKTAILAVAGDTTSNLLWRLQNGEGADGLEPKAMVVLIGTNDFGHIPTHKMEAVDEVASEISAGIVAICEQLLAHAPKAKLFLLGILPRGQYHGQMPSKELAIDNKPTLADHIQAINQQIEQYAQGREAITYLDCGSIFLKQDKDKDANSQPRLNLELMPDRLHPSAAGHEALLAECLIPRLSSVVSSV